MGMLDKALMNFSWAMDLDPKGSNSVMKEAFDTQQQTGGKGEGLSQQRAVNTDNSVDATEALPDSPAF